MPRPPRKHYNSFDEIPNPVTYMYDNEGNLRNIVRMVDGKPTEMELTRDAEGKVILEPYEESS